MKYDYLIVGSGLFGSIIAYEMNKKGKKCLVIENDFKEKYRNKLGKKKDITKYSKENFLYALQNSGITGMSGSDYPAFIKYSTKEKINYLIVNGLESEIYSSSDNALMYSYTEELLECIDENKQIQIFEVFKKNRKKTIIKNVIGSIISIFILLGWNKIIEYFEPYYNETYNLHISYFYIFPVLAIFIIIVCISIRSHWIEWREERDNIDSRIDKNKKEIIKNNSCIRTFPHMSFSAWKTITSLEIQQSQLLQMYTKTINLINNLRSWYSETNSVDNNQDFVSAIPTISLLDKSLIDNYFELNLKNSEICNIDLCEDIANHQISADYLSSYKNIMKQKLKDRLLSELDNINFNISNHVANKFHSQVAKEVTSEVIDDWYNQSKIFLHIMSTERAIIPIEYMIIAPNLEIYKQGLVSKLSTSHNPTLINSEDKYQMAMIQMAALSVDECVILN
mgnify:CR=1 FL=1